MALLGGSPSYGGGDSGRPFAGFVHLAPNVPRGRLVAKARARHNPPVSGRIELCDSIADPANDAVELTRQAMILARANAKAVSELEADDSGLELASLRADLVAALLLTPLSLDLSAAARSDLVACLEGALVRYDEDPRTSGFVGVAAHHLALSLEEVFGSRFFDHLAASGPRFLTTEDLLPRSTPLFDRDSEFGRRYGKTLSTEPSRLRPPQPGELQRYGRLAPAPPYSARLNWNPDWWVLDELEPDSIIAALHPLEFLDLHIPDVEEASDGLRFFGVAPKDGAGATTAALDLVKAADAEGAALVVLPELCLNRSGIDRIAEWIESEATNILVAVCGSCHEMTSATTRANNTIVVSSAVTVDRVVQAKIRPFELNGAREDIRHAEPTIHLLCSRSWSLVTPICIDLFDGQLEDFRTRLAPSLALVPACSESTGPLSQAAARLASTVQAHVVIANQRVPPRAGHAHADGAIKARPVRNYVSVIASVSYENEHAPQMRVTRLVGETWQKA